MKLIQMLHTCSPGTAVAWRNSLPVDIVASLVPCRAQCVKFGSYVVINIYAPSGSDKRQERNAFFGQQIFEAFSLFPECHYFLAGDFNCVLSPIDIENQVGFNQKFCPALKDLVSSFHLLDAFR